MVKVQVNVVNKVPLLTAPTFVSAIEDVSQAREWGERNGYSVVYWLKAKQRAYADKLSARVDAMAKHVEQQSAALVHVAEAG